MLESKRKSFVSSLGLVLLLIGFIIGVVGFGNAINATWGMSPAFRGFAELLFEILFVLLGNGLVNYGKNT
jgi:hypothetical protein